MRILGTEPSSVILLPNKQVQMLTIDVPKVPKQAKAKRGWCNKPKELQFQSILTRTILILFNATNQPKSTVELGYMCSRGLLGPPAVTPSS